MTSSEQKQARFFFSLERRRRKKEKKTNCRVRGPLFFSRILPCLIPNAQQYMQTLWFYLRQRDVKERILDDIVGSFRIFGVVSVTSGKKGRTHTPTHTHIHTHTHTHTHTHLYTHIHTHKPLHTHTHTHTHATKRLNNKG